MRILLPLLALCACRSDDSDAARSRDVAGACIGAGGGPLAMDETSPLGFSPDDVLAFLRPGFTTTLDWTHAGSTGLEFTFAEGDGVAEYAQWEPLTEDGDPCEVLDTLHVRLAVTWSTDDGVLVADDLLAVMAFAADDIELHANVLPDGDPTTGACAAGARGDEITMHAAFDTSGAHGEISCDNAGTVLATWP